MRERIMRSQKWSLRAATRDKDGLTWDKSLGLRTYTIVGGEKPNTRVGIPP